MIVGASAAGLRCAARLGRLRPGWDITVLERRDVFSYAACGLPYVLSGDIGGPEALRMTADGTLRDPEYFASVKGITVLPGREVIAIDPAGRSVSVRGPGGETGTLAWDELVLATGASARHLPGQPRHARVRSFHDLEDLEPLLASLGRGEVSRVIVVGGGLVGCELCEALHALWGIEVKLLEAAPALLPGLLDVEMGAVVADALRTAGVDVRTGARVASIDADEAGVRVRSGSELFQADLAIVAVGVAPEVELALAAGVALGPTGAIRVDSRLSTSVPHVWAAGDCVEVRRLPGGEPTYLPLGSLANRQGRVLAGVLAGRDDQFPGAAGAAAVKVFELNVAATGLTREGALRQGLKARSVWVTAHDRAHYWPEAREIFLHLVYEAGSRRLLGLQAAGGGEVAKRVDVATQLLARGATLADVAALEHAYSPPYAPAIEPLAVAAFAAENQEEGIEARSPGETLWGLPLLDVRHSAEQAERPLAEPARSLPLEEMRSAPPAPAEAPWLVVCERGGRSAEAVRLLQSQGQPSRYLAGGVRLRRHVVAEERA